MKQQISRIGRRQTVQRLVMSAAVIPLLGMAGEASAAERGLLGQADVAQGLRLALQTGASAAMRLLGAPDGFLGNPRVRIPLPGYLRDVAGLMKAIGQGWRVEELEVAMNRAAEQAVPLAGRLLADAVKTLTLADAMSILRGGETSATDFFAGRTREPLAAAFLPVVQRATAKVKLAAKYDRIAGKAADLGLVQPEDASVDHYVTRKALDGLYLVIGDEERRIRRDPPGTGSALLGRVFGPLR